VKLSLVLLVFVLALSVFSAGCGDSGSDTTTAAGAGRSTSGDRTDDAATADRTEKSPPADGAGKPSTTGDDDGGGGKATQSSFAKVADRICRTRAEERTAAVAAALRQREKQGKSMEDVSAFSQILEDRALPPLEQMVEELSQLDASGPDAGEAAEMVTSFEDAIGRMAAEPERVITGTDVFVEARKRAKALKLKDCAKIY
jgi:hypothetical protein